MNNFCWGILMKKIVYSALFLMSVMLTYSCSTMNELGGNVAGFKNRLSGGACERVDAERLKPASRLAVTAFEMEKAGLLEAFPYVRINPQAKDLKNPADYSSFRTQNVVVLGFNENQDGSFSQDMLCESMDRLGRIDVSSNRIVFALRQPDKAEEARLAKGMLDAAKIVQTCDAQARGDFKEAVREYQKANGLAADGSMGKNTARSFSQTTSIIDVKEMKSRIVYPDKPRSMVYVLPYDVIAAAPAEFNKGYESFDAVKREALSPEDFKKLAVPGKKFVVFVYFLDRVSPGNAIRVCVSESEMMYTDEPGPSRYAEPGAWPVISEILSVDDTMEPEKLFINVFIKGKFMYSCIASHQIM